MSRTHVWETQLVTLPSVLLFYHVFNMITVGHKQRISPPSLQEYFTFYKQYSYIISILTVHLLVYARGIVLSKHGLIVIRTQHSIVYVLFSIWHCQLLIPNFLSFKFTRIMKKIQSLFGMDQKSLLNCFRSLAKIFYIVFKKYSWRRYFLVSSRGFQSISQTI